MTETTSAAPSEREQFEAWAEHILALARDGERYADGYTQTVWEAWQAARRAQPTPPAVVEPPELSPDFTDTARAALLWVLWHHQGGSSPVGQPIRFALGMGQHDRLNEHHLAEAKRWERLHPVNPAVFPRVTAPLTDEQAKAVLWAEHLRWMKAAGLDTEGMQPTGEWLDHWLFYVRAIEAAHGIGIKKGGSHA